MGLWGSLVSYGLWEPETPVQIRAAPCEISSEGNTPLLPSVSSYVGITKGKAGTGADPRTYLKGVKAYPGISVR